MPEAIIYIFLSVILGLLVLANIYFLAQYRVYLKKYLSSGLENLILKAQLSDQAQKTLKGGISESEGFIKFLSDSREWAFDYIENVQEAIQDLKTAMDADDNEGIGEAYQKLVAYLPSEES